MGRVLGHFMSEEAKATSWYIHKFRVNQSRTKSNSWCLIVNLSWRENASVNCGIDQALCSLHYTRVNEVAKAVCSLAAGTELAKDDIKQHTGSCKFIQMTDHS